MGVQLKVLVPAKSEDVHCKALDLFKETKKKVTAEHMNTAFILTFFKISVGLELDLELT
jgi:hypothetical protein